MPDLSTIERNPEVEDKGQRKEIPTLPGLFCTLRSQNYKPYQRAIQQALSKLPRHKRDNELGRVMREEAATHLIVDWEDLTLGGEPLACNATNRTLIMTDRRFVDLANGIMAVTAEVGLRELEEAKEDQGN